MVDSLSLKHLGIEFVLDMRKNHIRIYTIQYVCIGFEV